MSCLAGKHGGLLDYWMLRLESIILLHVQNSM